jgi:hypothetical protein
MLCLQRWICSYNTDMGKKSFFFMKEVQPKNRTKFKMEELQIAASQKWQVNNFK